MKRGGAGNPLGENAFFNVFDDMKQGDGAGNPLSENVVFEDMKQEDEKGWSR